MPNVYNTKHMGIEHEHKVVPMNEWLHAHVESCMITFTQDLCDDARQPTVPSAGHTTTMHC